MSRIKRSYWFKNTSYLFEWVIRQCFSIRNFTYDAQETYFFDRSCYFVFYQQFLLKNFRDETAPQYGLFPKKVNQVQP